MKAITILGIIAGCKGKPVTNRYIMDVLVRLPEMDSGKLIYKDFGWDDNRVNLQIIRDNAKNLYIELRRLKKSGYITTKPIKKRDKKVDAADQKMLYTLTKAGIKEIEKNKQKST